MLLIPESSHAWCIYRSLNSRIEPILVRESLQAWYRNRAKEVLKERVCVMAANLRWINMEPAYVCYQCVVSGELFSGRSAYPNPQLIKAPRECIDYGECFMSFATLRSITTASAFTLCSISTCTAGLQPNFDWTHWQMCCLTNDGKCLVDRSNRYKSSRSS